MKPYEFLEHTADVGVKAYGKTLDEAFANAGHGMFDLLTDHSAISSVGAYTIKLSAEDKEQLLVDFLSELLFLQSAYNVVFGSIQVQLSDTALTAQIAGEPYSAEKHKQGVEIKAVTYHMLEVHENSPCFVQVLFDI